MVSGTCNKDSCTGGDEVVFELSRNKTNPDDIPFNPGKPCGPVNPV